MNGVVDSLIVALVFAALAQAWSWLGAYGGIVSLGHAVFFGIGAYAVAVSNLRGGSPWYGALGGALVAVIVAVVIGGSLLRGRGYVFAAATLVAGVLAQPFVSAQHWVGPANVLAFSIHPGFLQLQFSAKWPYLLLALAVFAVVQGLTYALRASRAGLALRALRANARAARGVGIAARPLQLLALVASAFVTSVVGSFVAQYRLRVDPAAMFGLALSFDIALLGCIAGPRWAWGPPIAALAYVLLGAIVPLHPPGAIGAAVLVVEGLLIVALARFRPDGAFAAPVRRVGSTPSAGSLA